MKPTLLALLGLGLRRGSRWRVLAIFAGLAVFPSVVAVLPIWTFLSEQLAHATGELSVARAVDLALALSDGQGGDSLALGLASGLIVALVVSPWSAGAALAEGRASEPMRVRGLLAAAGDLYGRLLRTLLVAALPLGVAAAIAGGLQAAAMSAGERAVTEAAADAAARWALAGGAAVLFLAHLTLDAGRAHLAAHPERRSAFLAWTAGAWLVLRRPVVTITIGALGTGVALGLAALLMAARGRLPFGPAWSSALGFVLATLATAAVAWGRSMRLAALSELAAFDAGERLRRRALRAARKASRGAPSTEPLLAAVTDPTPPPIPEPTPRPLDVTAPLEAPPKSGEG